MKNVAGYKLPNGEKCFFQKPNANWDDAKKTRYANGCKRAYAIMLKRNPKISPIGVWPKSDNSAFEQTVSALRKICDTHEIRESNETVFVCNYAIVADSLPKLLSVMSQDDYSFTMSGNATTARYELDKNMRDALGLIYKYRTRELAHPTVQHGTVTFKCNQFACEIGIPTNNKDTLWRICTTCLILIAKFKPDVVNVVSDEKLAMVNFGYGLPWMLFSNT